MTASKSEAREVNRALRRTRLLAPLVGTLLTACRAGLPPEPPGADPADANAPTPPYQAQANPYQTSAFAGEPPSTATGHEHMNHGTMDHGTMNHGAMKMDHGTMADKPAADAKPPPAAPMDHANMGTMADKPAVDAKPPPAAPMNHAKMGGMADKPGTDAKPPPSPAAPMNHGAKPAQPVKPPKDADVMPPNMHMESPQ